MVLYESFLVMFKFSSFFQSCIIQRSFAYLLKIENVHDVFRMIPSQHLVCFTKVESPSDEFEGCHCKCDEYRLLNGKR